MSDIWTPQKQAQAQGQLVVTIEDKGLAARLALSDGVFTIQFPEMVLEGIEQTGNLILATAKQVRDKRAALTQANGQADVIPIRQS